MTKAPLKAPALLAAIALPFVVSTCKERSCLEIGYDATVQLVREFNQGRCLALINGDQREFECPSGIMEGEINDRNFDFTLESPQGDFRVQENYIWAQCDEDPIFITEEGPINRVQHWLTSALRNLEVD